MKKMRCSNFTHNESQPTALHISFLIRYHNLIGLNLRSCSNYLSYVGWAVEQPYITEVITLEGTGPNLGH